ncbi:MAG: endolytic transglycosylase MltG [Lachnospiraceae bacterium]|jgi:UPF0755 protein|nr:endolytic transglycosylase MltG [Lachnospiraceae bacterium]
MSSKKIVFMIVKTVCSIILLMLIFSFVYSMCSKAYDFGFRIFAEDPVSPAPGHTVSVAIVEGKSVMEIGEILNSKGLIRDPKLFYFEEFCSDYHGRLQPGIYEFSTSMTPLEMMEIMATDTDDEEDEEETATGNSEPATEDTVSGDETSEAAAEEAAEAAEAEKAAEQDGGQ